MLLSLAVRGKKVKEAPQNRLVPSGEDLRDHLTGKLQRGLIEREKQSD